MVMLGVIQVLANSPFCALGEQLIGVGFVEGEATISEMYRC